MIVNLLWIPDDLSSFDKILDIYRIYRSLFSSGAVSIDCPRARMPVSPVVNDRPFVFGTTDAAVRNIYVRATSMHEIATSLYVQPYGPMSQGTVIHILPHFRVGRWA